MTEAQLFEQSRMNIRKLGDLYVESMYIFPLTTNMTKFILMFVLPNFFYIQKQVKSE